MTTGDVPTHREVWFAKSGELRLNMVDQERLWDGVYSDSEAYFGTDRSPFCGMCLSFLKDKPCSDVLELGPGQGRDSLAFVIEGYELTGCEVSSVACGTLKQRIPGMKVVLKDVREKDVLPPECFDACYAHMVLIMDMTPENIRTVMDNVYSALRPGGYFMFSVRNRDDPGFGRGTNTHDNVWLNAKGFAVNFFGKDEIESMCGRFGILKIEKFSEDTKRLYGVFLRKPE